LPHHQEFSPFDIRAWPEVGMTSWSYKMWSHNMRLHKMWSHKVSLWLLLASLAAALVVAGCAPDASAHIISPDLGEQLYADEAGQQLVVEPTPEPVLLASLSTEQIYAGLPPEILELMPEADPAHGEQLSLVNACVGCHSVDPNVQLAGPTWHNIGDTAANRQPGTSPALYLYTSMVGPDGYVVPTYSDAVMPETFDDTLSDQDLADLIAYLLTQNGNP
jgi:mono/diheme cytochrome c family protein